MIESVTDALQRHRVIVVAVDKTRGHVRVKSAADMCSVLSCSGETLVCCDEGTSPDLGTLNPGDVVKLEGPEGSPERIVVVRRAWDELTSPEW
jgi:hypothetical protein